MVMEKPTLVIMKFIQILEELKTINKSIQEINSKIDDLDRNGKPISILWGMLKSFVIGILIVGPVIAIVIILIQIIGNWTFN